MSTFVAVVIIIKRKILDAIVILSSLYCLSFSQSIRYFRCSGSISIIHYKRSGAPLEDMKSLKLKGRKYGNLRILNNGREVIRVQSEGNCCWRVNNKIHFTGTNQHIHSGYDGIPNINIKSVSRTSC